MNSQQKMVVEKLDVESSPKLLQQLLAVLLIFQLAGLQLSPIVPLSVEADDRAASTCEQSLSSGRESPQKGTAVKL